MDRIKTGIAGLDKVLEGFPSGKTVLVTGDAGAGKTVLALQFAQSACAQGLRTVYLSSEEGAADLRRQGSTLGWGLEALEAKGLLRFVELAGKRTEEIEISRRIGTEVEKGHFAELLAHVPKDVEALVVDSLGVYAAEVTPFSFKDQFDLLVYNLTRRGITALVVLDAATSRRFDDMALYSVYGAVRLLRRDNPFTGQRERAMDIVKMRATATPVELLPYGIGRGGIALTGPVEPSGKG